MVMLISRQSVSVNAIIKTLYKTKTKKSGSGFSTRRLVLVLGLVIVHISSVVECSRVMFSNLTGSFTQLTINKPKISLSNRPSSSLQQRVSCLYGIIAWY